MSSHLHPVLPWAVRRTRLPLLALRCVDCPSGHAAVGDGRFRVNANGKLLDVWLLVNCAACGRTGKLTVHDRVQVGALRADLLAGYTTNSPSLVTDTLLDPSIARRNRFALDWDGCWELDASPVPDDPWPVRVAVVFEDPVPVRPERLIARGLGLSRSEIARRVKIEIPLNRRTRHDFSFVLVCPAG
ncbi:DUF1062 domain-containing protein [Actinomadura sp. NEAU-AAG7]|uniref:DUF1062 domain-containing protein n=1 Tax=Actinomadura litoris TaxID=2678616 RepID=A0A7K1L416_9ACTN|nr:DUF1062 domain-containing protein [Actinomadura sp. NEAU-AAG7]MBT2210164.1 DUF1062 domain-containing protein [Actinomadura sp. NEAU-AAG7]MUN39015.1 DUF1062 domain-containing protein [Actinomadura litoris]